MAKTPAGSSALFRAAFLILILAFIFLIVGFTTANWTEIVFGGVLVSRTGLWKTCIGDGDNCGQSIYNDESWFVIVRTFVTLGLACFVIVLLMSLALLLVVSNQRLARVNIYSCLFTALFIAIGAATHTYRIDFEHVGYSCWMSWLSVVALVVAVILLECARKKAFRREMTLAHVEIVSEEPPGYHSYPMQDLTPTLVRSNKPRVPHQSGHHIQGHAVNPTPEKT